MFTDLLRFSVPVFLLEVGTLLIVANRLAPPHSFHTPPSLTLKDLSVSDPRVSYLSSWLVSFYTPVFSDSIRFSVCVFLLEVRTLLMFAYRLAPPRNFHTPTFLLGP